MLKALRHLGERVSEYDWSALRVVITTGEPIGPELHDWLEGTLGVLLQPYYGQSELAVISSACRHWFEHRTNTVGKRVPGHDLQILETHTGLRAESGVVGEIVVAADDPGLLLGYVDELGGLTTASGLDTYPTGDIGFLDVDGYLHVAGRHGDVIEPRVGSTAEIEDVVARLQGVKDAAAIGTKETDGRNRLVLCIEVGDLSQPPDEFAARLIQHIKQHLDRTVLPDTVVLLRAFPRTQATNKVNRGGLRRLVERFPTGDEYILVVPVVTSPT
jgi:acetyl-CoA synthetase